MSRRSVNRLRNGGLTWTRSGLERWRAIAAPGAPRVAPFPEDGRGARIELQSPRSSCGIEQTTALRGGKPVRIEAEVRCELQGSASDSGAALVAQALDARGRVIREWITEPILVARTPVRVRAYLQTPEGTVTLRVRVGAVRSRGALDVLGAAVIPILEPEWRSHALAIPPAGPPSASSVRRVALCVRDPGRRLVSLLLAALDGECGRPRLDVLPAETSLAALERYDAVLLPEDRLPRGLSSIGALLRFAANRVVVVSLPATASASRGAMRVRTVEQPEDPMHAYVTWNGPATRGFALHDGFPFAWEGSTPGAFVQRQATRTAAFKALCDRWELSPLLKSLCNTDAASDRVVGLARSTDGGGFYVLDLLPLEAPPSTLGEPAPLMTLVLNLLGCGVGGLGQFCVPLATEAEFRSLIREMAVRFRGCRVHDADVPAVELRDQIVSFTGAERSVRATSSAAPDRAAPDRGWIIIRTGRTTGDLESVYAAWMYFKQLVRMTPHVCPYVDALLSSVRLAWQPLGAAWEATGGFRRGGGAARPEALSGLREFLASCNGRLIALIDLVSAPHERVRVVGSGPQRAEAAVADWMPRLWHSFGPAPGFAFTPPAGAGRADRDAFTWRWHAPPIETARGDAVLDDPPAADAHRSGAAVWRVEIPGGDADFVARSIERTAIGATLLEHLIGLHAGLVAVNRRPHPVEFPPFAPVAPGEALIVPAGRLFPRDAAESA
ncbi:MAG: hypothetical protein KJ057_06720 [Phycisphaerae bacterium]|nr:MAG: hypothetical protein F9K17_08480 [Phycisphaerae bacterium]MBE7456681.1 hypothetical protein [Planctomycetia bacterium]MCK6463940.1 hypothetical protein [Phycisphaerae bacterium]MCL4718154.1 hypothetical protein [Phycisphaerae bacterium]